MTCWIFPTTLWCRYYYYSHFTHENTNRKVKPYVQDHTDLERRSWNAIPSLADSKAQAVSHYTILLLPPSSWSLLIICPWVITLTPTASITIYMFITPSLHLQPGHFCLAPTNIWNWWLGHLHPTGTPKLTYPKQKTSFPQKIFSSACNSFLGCCYHRCLSQKTGT